jgi:hypothetical protein
LTPKTVLPLFFAVGIIFAPIGGLLLWASSQVSLPIDPDVARARPITDFVALSIFFVSYLIYVVDDDDRFKNSS